MPQIVEVPGLGDVEFPDGTPRATMEGAIKRALLEGRGQQQRSTLPGAQFMPPSGLESVGESIKRFAGPTILRVAPGFVPNPAISMPLSGAGEAGAQFLESGKITSPGHIALATAVPPAAAAAGRLVRGLGRTATRLIPSAFEKAQRGARQAGEALVGGLRPAEDVAALARSARAGGTDLIPAGNIQRIIGEIRLPSVPANPKVAAVKTTIENLKAVLKPGAGLESRQVLYHGSNRLGAEAIERQGFLGGHTETIFLTPNRAAAEAHATAKGGKVFAVRRQDVPKEFLEGIETGPAGIPAFRKDVRVPIVKAGASIQLEDLEAIRRDIGPLLQSKGAPAELRGIYGAIVSDLEKEAAGGGVGASLARQTAAAFKQDLGAAKVAELLDKATTIRTIAGADVPALNLAKFSKLVQEGKTKTQLVNQIGPEAFRTVEEFVVRFRGLPPEMAYTGWNSLLSILSGGAGVMSGRPITGAIVGALAPELIRNMAAVGANPAALNTVMISIAQGMRAATIARSPLGAQAGLER